MKKRAILSAVLVAIYLLTMPFYNSIRTPLTAAATAAQLDDTARSFLAAQFWRDGAVENAARLLLIVTAVAIWLRPSHKQTQEIDRPFKPRRWL